MKIFNGTPHNISIITEGIYFDIPIRKYVTDEPEVDISIPSDGVLSAKINTVDLAPIQGIPCFGKAFAGVDVLPKGYDVFIVSALYACAVKSVGGDISQLYTVADPVYSLDGRTILGSRGIAPFM